MLRVQAVPSRLQNFALVLFRSLFFGATNFEEEIYNLMNKFRNSHNVKHALYSLQNKKFHAAKVSHTIY